MRVLTSTRVPPSPGTRLELRRQVLSAKVYNMFTCYKKGYRSAVCEFAAHELEGMVTGKWDYVAVEYAFELCCMAGACHAELYDGVRALHLVRTADAYCARACVGRRYLSARFAATVGMVLGDQRAFTVACVRAFGVSLPAGHLCEAVNNLVMATTSLFDDLDVDALDAKGGRHTLGEAHVVVAAVIRQFMHFCVTRGCPSAAVKDSRGDAIVSVANGWLQLKQWATCLACLGRFCVLQCNAGRSLLIEAMKFWEWQAAACPTLPLSLTVIYSVMDPGAYRLGPGL